MADLVSRVPSAILLPADPAIAAAEAFEARPAEVRSPVELSVVVPAYNEQDRILPNLRETARTLTLFCPSWDIIVVDDGSRDATTTQVRRAQAEIRTLRLLRLPAHAGKGRALSAGAAEAAGDFVVFLDADLEVHPQQIPILQHAQRLYDADVVTGTKTIADPAYRFPLVRRVLSRSYALLVRLLFRLPLRDTQCGLKLFRRQVLRETLPRVRAGAFAFDVELLVQAHRLGFRLAEAPVAARFLRRSNRLSIRDVVRIWWETLAIFWRTWSAGPADRTARAGLVSSGRSR